METTAAESTPAEQSQSSLWEDFIDIYYAPREVFARRADGGRWGLVLLVIVVLMVLLYYATQTLLAPVMEAEFARAMQGNPGMSAEQMEQARSMATTFGLLGFIVSFPVIVLATGLLIWGVGRMFDAAATVGAAMLIATYAQFPRLVQSALTLVQGLVLDVDSMDSIMDVTFSPARFMDPDAGSEILFVLAGRLDLFILWGVVLIAIGLQVIGRVPRVQSYVAAGLVWLLGAVPMVLGVIARGG